MTNKTKYKRDIERYEKILHTIDDKIKVVFGYIGEGKKGKYRGDENDIPLLRFWVYRKPYTTKLASGFYTIIDEWKEIQGLTYRTNLKIDAKEIDIIKKANQIAIKTLEIWHKIENINYVSMDEDWEKFVKKSWVQYPNF